MLFGIYRPGSAPLTNIFFDELSTVLQLLMTYSCPVIVCGDYNVHVDITILLTEHTRRLLARATADVRMRAARH